MMLRLFRFEFMRNAQDRGKNFFVRGQRLTVAITRDFTNSEKIFYRITKKIIVVENKIKLSGQPLNITFFQNYEH